MSVDRGTVLEVLTVPPEPDEAVDHGGEHEGAHRDAHVHQGLKCSVDDVRFLGRRQRLKIPTDRDHLAYGR